MYGISRGAFAFMQLGGPEETVYFRVSETEKQGWRAPTLGGMPSYESLPGGRIVILPLWLPLSVIVAWITVRELRWREKRAKNASLAT